ncbi:MAG: aminomethyl-transferring glycine dehydrogenase [Saprospiraceae bacterium]|nr:aminomethyl-transferring glycine dehydrogenase [Saprospiraceae bacterium]MBK8547589.1 aminomethyl-transferring glycine dehydrogenase [Saprospiraceae bacterium]MBK9042718.1 aminomethyl-transferring glycine dehydrogenase [Saprospiraceae bacterium]MBP6693620.1 aminomethyl-transferring glycine dehydrogenase [Saprospiraceae bacterium]
MINQTPNQFIKRHIGITPTEEKEMLKTIGVNSIDQLIDETVPTNIMMHGKLNIPSALSEFEYLKNLQKTASKNKVFRTFIGQGYYNTITPSVIARNIFHNPGWYTQYTPYQAEIAQGRLEALLNFQTMVSDLTGLPIANASLLDEGTAAAEAMAMCEGIRNKKRKNDPSKKFFVDRHVFKQTLDVVQTRAIPLFIEVVVGDIHSFDFNEDYIGVLIQYPNGEGKVEDFQALTSKCNELEIQVIVCADLLSLTLLKPPGEWGADVVIGNSQRLGVPMGFGGPHAAFFATRDEHKRIIPGRIIGVSVDHYGKPALRMALQTREQHIRREKATSNICTAQALLAVMASMYAVYHGPDGLKDIALQIHKKAKELAERLGGMGIHVLHQHYFDTITISADESVQIAAQKASSEAEINFYYGQGTIGISLDETTLPEDLDDIVMIFAKVFGKESKPSSVSDSSFHWGDLTRTTTFLEHPVFSGHHSESKMMRYIKSLENKDLSLVHSMISLGSCTMKLNAASEMFPVSWPEFANIHPFAPESQTLGYKQIFDELSAYLCEITGFQACSLQPNSGAQGEYAGLLTIRSYHYAHNNSHRDIALIPSSAHGTNPASAVMCGMQVVVVACDEKGNIDMEDLRNKSTEHKDNLSCLMVTYPSTHGVFETSIKEICNIIHDNGGLVYMDGANMNAQVGLTSPGLIGADVCHLNLHKTFAIPHGGGGPGMGPICVNDKLAPFLPGHVFAKTGGKNAIKAVSSAPWGSASILLISYGYIKMLGSEGVTLATKYAILNANYMKARLEGKYEILYSGEKGRAAHEMIIDLRPFKALVSAEDVAKRLMDYGFHAPTLSFPVAGTIMVEPTESEDKDELDRFCDALLMIREEIDQIARGEMSAESNVLSNAPHTQEIIMSDAWTFTYSREKAAFPISYLKERFKFWPTVSRIDGAYGDRNLVCICPPIEEYMK